MNNDLTAEPNDKNEQQDKLLDSHDLLLNGLLMLLSDLCLTRFQLLMAAEQDPSEAAKEVIEGLDRYDFLSELAVSEASYLELKKQIENDIGNEAEKVIRRENPRSGALKVPPELGLARLAITRVQVPGPSLCQTSALARTAAHADFANKTRGFLTSLYVVSTWTFHPLPQCRSKVSGW